MKTSVLGFTDEQARILINLAQHYEVWMEAQQGASALPYGMTWKTVNNKHYLYELIDRRGNGKSLGPRSRETEMAYNTYREEKEASGFRLDSSRKVLAETCAVYRSIRLPLIAAEAAKILREADKRHMLGEQVLVVGTNAMAAYCIEAGGFINDAPGETQDFDMTWSAADVLDDGTPIWAMLKAVDCTYTVNTERPFQARNASAYEVELLAAPSRIRTLRKGDKPRPIPLEEQEWLLLGHPVDHVVVARDGSPARLVVPDPRWFALQKLWMSVQGKRNPLKRTKDAKQGTALLNAIRDTMPQYPLDAAFEAEIPSELKSHYEGWRDTAQPASTPEW
jgi:hypothetical protein